jgi:glutathione peroxidase
VGAAANVSEVTVYDLEIGALGGGAANLAQYRGRVLLIVNVASRCGLTPQYTGLQQLATEQAARGLTVLGVPCNQFGGQEPGTDSEIQTFCDVNYGVTFPLTEKVEVNGPGRHPLYELLTAVPDASGVAGDVQWNFEKFLVGRDGTVAGRFRGTVTPGSPELVAAIGKALST